MRDIENQELKIKMTALGAVMLLLCLASAYAYAQSCSNGIQDPGEENIDCGGSCLYDCLTYFVDKDAVGGFTCNDNGTGRISQPYCTIQKASDKSAPGQIILVRKGVYNELGINDQYRGLATARIMHDGTNTQPITFKAFPGENPVLDGADTLTGFMPCSSQAQCANIPLWNKMYYAPLTQTNSSKDLFLMEDGVLLEIASDPEPYDRLYFTRAQDNWRRVPANGYTNSSFSDPTFFTNPDPQHYVGSYIKINSCNNNVMLKKILSYNPSTATIVFENITCPININNDEYALFNHWEDIDKPGEYYFDERTSTLYLYPENPVPTNVRIGVRNKGFDIRGHDNIVIDGFTFTGYTDSLDNLGGAGITNYNFGSGYLADNLIIKNNTFFNLLGSAVLVGGINNTLVENNYAYNTSLGRVFHLSGARNNTIANNKIVRGGRTGLVFYAVKGGKIINNTNFHSKGEHSNGLTVYLESEDIVIANNTVLDSNIAFTFQSSRNITATGNVLDSVYGWNGLFQGTSPDTIIFRKNTNIGQSMYVGSDFVNVTMEDNILPDTGSSDFHRNNILTVQPAYDPANYNESVEKDYSKLFIDQEAGDFRLYKGIVIGVPEIDACTGATDGGHIGAKPCVGCLDENPTAIFTTSTTSGIEDLTVDFNASTSFVCGNDSPHIVRYHWNFDDGSVLEGPAAITPSHTFSAGSYQVTLTITDSSGRTDSIEKTITVFTVTERNLLLYYSFDDTVADLSGSGFHGRWDNETQSDIPGYYIDGKIGKAGDFAGRRVAVWVPNTPVLRGFSEITFSIWAKRNVTTSTGDVFYKHGHYGLNLGSSTAVFSLSGNATTGITVASPIDTQWHHYAMTYNGTQFAVYIDGVLKDQKPKNGPIANQTYDSWRHVVGTNSMNMDRAFDGYVDEYKIYNQGFSAQEIQLLFLNNKRDSAITYGDVNDDSTVSAYDSALVAQASVGLLTLTASQNQAAEVSGDNIVSAYDAALISQYAVGLITKFPAEG